jgi:hypothetical protein
MNQTAVEWLVNVVQSCIAPDYIPKEIVEQANKMFEQQIIEAYNKGEFNDGMNETAEEYFNNTYNQ